MKSLYNNTISEAVILLKNRQLKEVSDLLHAAIAVHDYRPEAYNLLGIYYEMIGDTEKAIKFYRVSYYFDQSYLPSYNNLSRLADAYKRLREKVDFGEWQHKKRDN